MGTEASWKGEGERELIRDAAHKALNWP